MDLAILSAENYYDGAFSEGKSMENNDASDQWLGGLLAHRIANPIPSKKKQQKNENPNTSGANESTGMRQRGRPRLNTRDQTAAERRRTQIRLAQRAYRQRKETTISGLNRRVAALEQTIEEMNKAFLDFNDKAIASGIGDWGPSLAEDLKLTMQRFLEHARNMAQESEIEDEPTPNLSARVFGQEGTYPRDVAQSSVISIKSAKPAEQSQSDLCPVVVAALGYESNIPPDTDIDVGNAQSSEMDSTHAMQISNLDVSDWVEPVQPHRVDLPESIESQMLPLPFLNNSLPLPTSYSFQEKSFARRLLRSSLEDAYRLMINPKAREEDIFRFCMNTFTWSNKKLCIAKIEDLLSKTAQDSLENWTAPQWHVGNSGIHYPRAGFDLDSLPPLGWDSKAFTGPLPLVQADNPMDVSLSTDDIIKLLGFDGEWFDPNDVEQYLRSKGLFFDGHSTFVEVDVNFPTEPPLESSLSASGSPTYSSQDSIEGLQTPQNADMMHFDDPVLRDSWSEDMLRAPDFLDRDLGSLLDTPNPAGTKSTGNLSLFDPEKGLNMLKKRYIDVEKFVHAIAGSGVCLGRAPGYRRSSVDSALLSAIIHGA